MPHSSPAMEQFLASVERRAFRMAQIATGNTEDALDIVQDAMFGLVKHYAHKSPPEWKPLFYRILVSRIRDWFRRQKIRGRWRTWLRSGRRQDESVYEDPLEMVPDTAGRNPADQTLIGDSLTALEFALRKLPLRQQQAFLLRAWEELSVGETAAVMKCSTGSVKTHYSRAIHRLREALEDHWS